MMAGLLDRLLSSRLRVLKLISVVAVAVAFCAFQICHIAGIRINTSPSLPIGLYRTSSSPKFNLIDFCPGEPFASFAISRGYRSRGACPDGAAPLLKPVVATSGDTVEFSDRGIEVNGKLLPNTAPLTTDTKGRPLVSWKFGRYSIPPGHVWVASSFNPRSFDSRYFGPVPISAIRSRVRPLLTWR